MSENTPIALITGARGGIGLAVDGGFTQIRPLVK
jgi:NAD(P)-dependent dehydrogenase (short-subunit alcohol dehydrogenase family)